MKTKIKNILKEKSNYAINGTLWIECDNNRFLGPGRVELLQLIDSTGSLNKAAKEMKMSYKKAWEMIAELNQQTNKPLVISKSGGVEGGGSTISEEAKQLINYHQKLRKIFLKFMETETKKFNTEITK